MPEAAVVKHDRPRNMQEREMTEAPPVAAEYQG